MNKKYNLTLCMIVKNEEDNIKGTLENIVENFNIDYWVISDTGSSDNTINTISETFTSLNIPGKFHNKDWKDFSTNRNYVIEEAEKDSNFLLFFDADDKVVGNFKLPELTADSYMIKFGPSFIWHRIFIVKTLHKWRYKGILHEYITCDYPAFSRVTITGNYHVIPGTHGCRSKDPNKYLNDGLVFEKAINDPNTPADLIPRYMYYCGQSYKDALRMDRAIEFYEKTLEENGWVQEKYIACKILGEHYKKTNPNKAIEYFSKSRIYDPSRVECIMHIADCISDKKIKLSILTSIKPHMVADPCSDKYLFIDIPTHNIYFFNTIIILAYQLGERKIVCDYLTEQIKRHRTISETSIKNIFNNIILCLNNYSNKELLTLFSTVNKIIIKNNFKYNNSQHLYSIGRDKMEDIVCKLDNIPVDIFNKTNNLSINVVFNTNSIERFIHTFNSFINCFEDRDSVDEFTINCTPSFENELKLTYPQFNFITFQHDDTISKYDYTMYLDCNNYFFHKESYFSVFISKLNNNISGIIPFNESNYFKNNNVECMCPAPMSFNIMHAYKKKIELEPVSNEYFNKILYQPQ